MAQRVGEAASSRAGERMAGQWLELVNTPEWRHLARAFPDAMQQLSAATAGNRVRPAAVAQGGDGAGSV